MVMQSRPGLTTGLANPMLATLHFAQAQKAYNAGLWLQACQSAQSAIAAAGQDAGVRNTALNLLAAGLWRLHQPEQALQVWRELDRVAPRQADVLANIGFALSELQRHSEAIGALEQAVALVPSHLNARINLGLAYSRLGMSDAAKACFIKATRIDPQYAKAYGCLADVLQAAGEVEAAQAAYAEVIRLEPNSLAALGNRVFLHHTRYPFDLEQHMTLVRAFGAAIDRLVPSPKHKSKSEFKPHHPLRIGLVSADFRNHVVASFLLHILTAIRSDVELQGRVMLVGYYNLATGDQITESIQRECALWREVAELGDEQLAAQIKADEIDILIDLSGHTAGHRLPVFARRPAPLAVSWLGYWGSTGVSAIDFVLADPVTVPADEERWLVERVWRLPHLRYCFAIPEAAPDISLLPCLTHETVTLGCYQSIRKINAGVLALWSRILAEAPQTRLRIQSQGLDQEEIRRAFIERMRAHGIDSERVTLHGGMSADDYLASYAEVDFVLDTFPYPGGTTTAQALWMGVPTLTLATPGMLGRQGQAMLVNAGLVDWVTTTEDEYVAQAVMWIDPAKHEQLAELRTGLREQVRVSPVFDGGRFAHDWVAALEAMWQRHCT